MSLTDTEMKAEAWDSLVELARKAEAHQGSRFGMDWVLAGVLAKDDEITALAAVPEAAEPIHTAMCTRMSTGNGGSTCIGYHCPHCGLPCSSQGHGAPEGCEHARAQHERLRGGDTKPGP